MTSLISLPSSGRSVMETLSDRVPAQPVPWHLEVPHLRSQAESVEEAEHRRRLLDGCHKP
jgi:hypothetical protein